MPNQNMFKAKKREKDGKIIERDMKSSNPIVKQLMDNYVAYESKVVDNLKKLGFIEKT